MILPWGRLFLIINVLADAGDARYNRTDVVR